MLYISSGWHCLWNKKKLSQMIDQMEIKTEIDTIMMLGAIGVNDSVSEWYL